MAYASGNNLIIYTSSKNQTENIQTITLEKDVAAVTMNDTNGIICISIDNQIVVFSLEDEYSNQLKWIERLRLENDHSKVNCLQIATEENELVVGSDNSLSLYHLYIEFGEIKWNRRWFKEQPSPVESISITSDGGKIVSYCNSNFDSFAKVWLRISYGDDSTLFDLVYADHERSTYIVNFQWRKKISIDAESDSADTLASMLHIKNMRTVMTKLSSDDNDILYCITNDKKLHIWATCEFNGHIYLKRWHTLDLLELVPAEYMTSLIIESSSIAGLLSELLQEEDEKNPLEFLKKYEMGKFDLLLVIGKSHSALYCLSNVLSNPPSAISVDQICMFPTNYKCLPRYRAKILSSDENTPLPLYLRLQNPIHNSSLVVMPTSGDVSFLMHDLVKNSIRCVKVKLNLAFNSKPSIRLLLLEKFQGHSRPIRKLITSSASHENNIMLSILDYPEYNYIWEPLKLDSNESSMSITKRFRLNVTREGEGEDEDGQGVVDAVIINDIMPSEKNLRHHLIACIEKGGYFSVWDCDGVTMDDNDVKLIERFPIRSKSNTNRTEDPHTLFLQKEEDNTYVVVAIYGPADHFAWKLQVNAGITTCQSVESRPFPGEFSKNIEISTVDTFLEKDVSVIDEDGRISLLSGAYDRANEAMLWTRISTFRTSIKNASFIRGASLINRVAVVDESGSCLSIWDTKYSNLEFEEHFPENYGPVRDIDWTFIGSKGSSANALLSVGFLNFVLLFTQLRYDYTNRVPTFAVLKKIDISHYSTLKVADLIWLDDLNLVIGSGNQFFVDDRFVELGGNKQGLFTTGALDNTIRQLLPMPNSTNVTYQVSDLVKILNGPIPVYHPQFLIQAFLLNEVDAVEAVLVRLLTYLRSGDDVPWDLQLNFLQLLRETGKTENERRRNSILGTAVKSGTLSGFGSGAGNIFDAFNKHTAELLTEKLATTSLPLLTRHQQGTLRNLVISLDKLHSQRGTLDENGYKFLCSFELFQLSPKQKKLSMRDISWAVHSEQKEVLYSAVTHVYKRMDWQAVKKCGLVFWLDDRRLKELIENVARCEFADERDASGRVSILYLAIKKKQLLIGLWKTTSHPEKDKVLKFLGNNFTQPRWQSAALKNAFVLLGKHRYLDAAYFFLLANKVKDCCLTLCNKLDEVELALAVAKVNEDKDALMLIIERYVLPKAVAKGDRWYTSWVFWELGLAEISIQALVKSPRRVVTQNCSQFLESFQLDLKKTSQELQSRSFLRDDPVLAALYEKLRGAKVDYYQGSQTILPEEESDFVVRVCSIYARMGCDYLALMILRNWRFATRETDSKMEAAPVMKDIFLDFKMDQSESKAQSIPAASNFVEPDMSSFSFGF